MADVFTNYQTPAQFRFPVSMTAGAGEADISIERTHDMYAYPAFIFPARSATPAMDMDDAQEDDAPSPNAVHTSARSIPHPLPAFTFPASGRTPLAGSEDQSTRNVQAFATPTRVGRHRRTTSELTGEDSYSGAPRFRSVSPSKLAVLGINPTPPQSLPTTPKRGHRHRRSAALSISEVAGITKLSSFGQDSPNENLPTTAASVEGFDNDSGLNSAASSPGFGTFENRNSAFRSHRPQRSPGGPRVGFSDKTEIIPRRPLSTISSETEGSFSTSKRLSTADSISSLTNSLNDLSRVTRSPLATTFEDVLGQHLPQSAGQLVGTTRRVSVDEFKPAGGRPASQSLRKFPSWTSLMSRKPRASDSPRSQPSPIIIPSSNDGFSLQTFTDLTDVELNENFDEDPTSAIVSDYPEFTYPSSCPTLSTSRVQDWMNHESKDNESSMIDLDAALDVSSLGSRSPTGMSFAGARRNMHSHSRLSGFGTSGSHHRRTESAPQLVYSNVERPPARRLNSSSTSEERRRFEMEHLSEEDEGAEDRSQTQASTRTVPKPSTPFQFAADPSLDSSASEVSSLHIVRPGSASSSPQIRPGSSHASRHESFAHSPLMFSDDDVLLADADIALGEETHLTSSESTVTAALHEDRASHGKARIPSLTLSQPSMNPSHITFCDSGPASECSCSIAGGSSTRVTSNNIPFGEAQKFSHPGDGHRHDIRKSVDDVPSLISSGSTMTSYVRQASMSSPSLAAAAPSINSAPSIKSEVPQRRRNRASIASLSRLMGTSFGAKSSLSVNTLADYSPAATDVKREKKGSRLGRLFRFWKPKQGSPA